MYISNFEKLFHPMYYYCIMFFNHTESQGTLIYSANMQQQQQQQQQQAQRGV